MEALYHQTNKLIQETQHLFTQLDRPLPNVDVNTVESEILAKINLINSNCEKLDVLCMKGPITQRQNAKMRVDQLKYDSRHLSAALNSWRSQQYRRKQEEEEREALLSRQFTTNDHIDIMIDHNLQHNDQVRNANEGIDNLIQHGSGILENLRSQRMTIKGAHRRLIDIGNTLGLSNTTMRLIENRARQDGFILVAGIVLTCIIMTLVVLYMT
ncbi:Golgi SNAP receptor complex member 2 [Cotesia glomerata]|uniref:Golgi SNAP receptor complex member 2 n=1 Tax=Cotesia glomerata TaxID=32391 RepID=A0AAV7IQ03_COTGL|nr:Golgi SNAP receptor complex member 2 [Cotesia glomerata]KAH0556605.1 hypothetical protein KQX54_001291 [Cotesia glomerata]